MFGAAEDQDDELRIAVAANEARATWSAVAVVIGLIGKIVLAVNAPNAIALLATWGPIVADGLIALGIAGEILFTRMARANAELRQRISDETIAELKEQAAKTELDRLQLEVQLQPRVLTKEQFDLIEQLRGKLKAISIAYETDAETWWYASALTQAFFAAGVKVFQYRRSPEIHTYGMLLYDPLMVGVHLSPHGETLLNLFRATGTTLALIDRIPADVGASADIPAIFVGGRFNLPPPYGSPLGDAGRV